MKQFTRWIALTAIVCLLFSVIGCNFVLEREVVRTEVLGTSTSAADPETDSTTDVVADPDASTTGVVGGQTTGGQQTTGGGQQTTGGGQQTTNRVTTTTKKPAETRTEAPLSGKLELQIFTNESQSADGGWTNVINNFEDLTGVSVTAQIGSSVNTMMSNRWKKDNPPDMIWLDGSGIPDKQYETSGKFYDLTEVYENGYVWGTTDRIKDVVNANLVSTGSSDKLYRLPVLMTAGGVWYDARFLKEKIGWANPPLNYDELLKLGKDAKAKGYSTFTYPGIYSSYALSNVIAPAVAAYGQGYLNQWLSGSAAAVKDARFKSIMQRFADFCRTDGYLMEGSTTMDHTSTQQRWINHATVLIANGLWLPDETRKLWSKKSFDMTWSTSPLIQKNQKQTIILSGKRVAVATKAKNRENALAFVRFLFREDSQNYLMYSFGYMGVRTDMPFDTAVFIQEGGGSDPTRATATALDYVNSSRVVRTYWDESWGTLGDEIALEINELAMKGGKSVQASIDRLASVAPKK